MGLLATRRLITPTSLPAIPMTTSSPDTVGIALTMPALRSFPRCTTVLMLTNVRSTMPFGMVPRWSMGRVGPQRTTSSVMS